MHHQRIRVLLNLFPEMYSIRSIEDSPVSCLNMSLVLFSLHRRGSFSLSVMSRTISVFVSHTRPALTALPSRHPQSPSLFLFSSAQFFYSVCSCVEYVRITLNTCGLRGSWSSILGELRLIHHIRLKSNLPKRDTVFVLFSMVEHVLLIHHIKT